MFSPMIGIYLFVDDRSGALFPIPQGKKIAMATHFRSAGWRSEMGRNMAVLIKKC